MAGAGRQILNPTVRKRLALAVLAYEDEIDGPMLLHGLQDFQGGRLRVLPRRRTDQPDREALAERYEAFRTG